jgi:hypothetical protein
METINVRKEEIKKAIKSALRQVENRWTGWGVDITISPVNGAVLISDYNNGNVVYNNCKKFCRVETEDRKKLTRKQLEEETDTIYFFNAQFFQPTIDYLKRTKGINIVID